MRSWNTARAASPAPADARRKIRSCSSCARKPPRPSPDARLRFRVVDAGSTQDAPAVRLSPRADGTFVSVDVKHNGWPGEEPKETDLALILQIENPGAPDENRVLSSDRLPFKAYSGVTIHSSELSPAANGVPLFREKHRIPGEPFICVKLFPSWRRPCVPVIRRPSVQKNDASRQDLVRPHRQ